MSYCECYVIIITSLGYIMHTSNDMYIHISYNMQLQYILLHWPQTSCYNICFVRIQFYARKNNTSNKYVNITRSRLSISALLRKSHKDTFLGSCAYSFHNCSQIYSSSLSRFKPEYTRSWQYFKYGPKSFCKSA